MNAITRSQAKRENTPAELEATGTFSPGRSRASGEEWVTEGEEKGGNPDPAKIPHPAHERNVENAKKEKERGRERKEVLFPVPLESGEGRENARKRDDSFKMDSPKVERRANAKRVPKSPKWCFSRHINPTYEEKPENSTGIVTAKSERESSEVEKNRQEKGREIEIIGEKSSQSVNSEKATSLDLTKKNEKDEKFQRAAEISREIEGSPNKVTVNLQLGSEGVNRVRNVEISMDAGTPKEMAALLRQIIASCNLVEKECTNSKTGSDIRKGNLETSYVENPGDSNSEKRKNKVTAECDAESISIFNKRRKGTRKIRRRSSSTGEIDAKIPDQSD